MLANLRALVLNYNVVIEGIHKTGFLLDTDIGTGKEKRQLEITES